jgi:hypothetical protein
MTEPSPQRPVPGPPRPGPGPHGPSTPAPAPAPSSDVSPAPSSDASPAPAAVPTGEVRSREDRFADLEHRPVAEHVAVFEAEHGRLQRELGTIDQL